MTMLSRYADTAPHRHLGDTSDLEAIQGMLAAAGVRLERWAAEAPLDHDATDADVLAAYASAIARLQAIGGYRSSDVIRLTPDHPDRATLRTKFLAEHVHDDDEVRFFVEGAGLFYIRHDGVVHALECTAGDLILLPAGTVHWFDTGERPCFTAIRLFTTPDGWVARFTGDPIAQAIPLYEQAP
ncbi:AraC family ligand binding domain-containing protein [Sphingobium sp. Sx8-8]|uniref:1,2-dihydroxy-3-keto-5-methylthiopentene dioxygenase n=1 Tax=Sphingobium sp. Sx8-8 TaxID=2933617 RepID=UPI001F57B80C|nr:AraC family ligand binding domain-containing protein [Sphingobium sp. Sx8-8]